VSTGGHAPLTPSPTGLNRIGLGRVEQSAGLQRRAAEAIGWDADCVGNLDLRRLRVIDR